MAKMLFFFFGLLVAIFYLLACKVNIRGNGNETLSRRNCGGEDKSEEHANIGDEEGRYLLRGGASRRYLLRNNDA